VSLTLGVGAGSDRRVRRSLEPKIVDQEAPLKLKDIAHRLEGLQGRIQKDAQTSGEIAAFEARLASIVARLGARPDLEDARFMIEEYRVAVFAQRLRTKGKVSAKRIESVLVPLEEEAGVR